MRRFVGIFIVLVACFDSAGSGIYEGDIQDTITATATATDTLEGNKAQWTGYLE